MSGADLDNAVTSFRAPSAVRICRGVRGRALPENFCFLETLKHDSLHF